jgi:hypothetical protein
MTMTFSGLDNRKQPNSVDNVLDHKFNIIAQVIDERFDKLYQDFNLAMEAKSKQDQRAYMELTNLVNVAMGVVNEQKIRIITLENHILKNNIGTPEELEAEYNNNIQVFKEASGWKEIPLASLKTGSYLNATEPVQSLDPLEEPKPF